ncbi:hypothetical protein DRE_01788 [Drechslerella stenobrocha 248]|uniref:YMC020W-like alpha/beta hydrolase domain-containing protein n=1 Tax=Drechslerella stenobrocha 248 TaxID=1043628 RepID=W7HWM9_9PEZI|nr:hypothetical protein DRE_01788 [Drechslerella stenobrocha 248]
MSRKRAQKPSSSHPPIQQNPSAASSTSSITSQATVTTQRDDASAAGSAMSRSAASALESTASVVHKVKTRIPEVAQAIPQRLPQNLARLANAKATPSTQVAQETAARTPSLLSPSPPRTPSGPQKSVSPMAKHLSTPKATTQLTNVPESDKSGPESNAKPGAQNGHTPKPTPTGEDERANVDPSQDESITASSAVPESAEQKPASSYWYSWWGAGQVGPAGTSDSAATQDPTNTQPEPTPKTPLATAESSTTPRSKSPPTVSTIENIKANNKTVQKVRSAENLRLKRNFNSSTASIKTAPPTIADTPGATDAIKGPVPSNPPQAQDETPTENTQPQQSSWFGYWYGTTSQAPVAGEQPDGTMGKPASDGEVKDPANQEDNQIEGPPCGTGSSDATPEDLGKDNAQSKPTQTEGLLARGAAWVFWSKPAAQPDGSNGAVEAGEIAVAGSSSETEPQRAELTNPPPQPPAQARKANGITSSSSGAPGSAPIVDQQPPAIPVAPKEVSSAAKTLQKVLPPSLLVPSFDSCFNPQQSRSWFTLGPVNRFWSNPKAYPRNQLSTLLARPRVRKAVAIGVHGFFPMKLVQRVLGEPTGTSIRFATEGADAIQRWADKHNISVDIEKIALEGEGRVVDRVEILWKLLENKLDIIEKADFVLVCCHSQGTPVGVHLVARMIEFGVVDNSKVGIIGMAGINLGPFPELNSRILSGSAKELFEFSDPTSLASQQYIESLTAVLAHGVKLIFVGSIDDQLVSLYSSTFSNISHPFIYRAVFVDGRVHAPDFISHAVGLALKLRNIGLRDHGIIRELSGPLAGSLYTGGGHSRIYDDAAIYDLGVRHTLETNTKEFLRVPLKVEEFQLPSTTNPYILPWAMRGMLEERRVQGELHEEAKTLLEEFAKWHPTSKVLKDVKFRLEAIRSRL